jgi:UDP-glucose 4-epimerase
MDDALILVTGGAGFIGSHVVDALLARGTDVRVLDDFSTGKEENLDGAWALAAQGGAGLQVVEGDVRDEVRMRDAVDGCAAVVHLAAAVSVPRSMTDPVGCDSVTHGGTVNAVRQAVEAGVERFVLASSCAVYGDAEDLPIAETTRPRPLSPYASAKLAAEETCADAADAGQLSAVCLRFFNVYGPRQDPGSAYSGVISRFLSAAAAGDAVTIYGNGRQTRDFIYVGDVVDAIVMAVQRPLTGTTVLNVGAGRQTDLLQLLDAVERQSGAALERRAEPPREGDIRRSCADAGRALWVLGWEAGTTLDEGLARTWEWFVTGRGDGAWPASPQSGRDGE